MRFQFLGTSAGTPTRARNVTALAMGFDQGSDWYLFDCGEATQQQILHTNYSLARLSRIFITHLHGDHIFGLPGMLASRSLAGSGSRPLELFGPKGIREYIETNLRLSHSRMGYDLAIHEYTQAGELIKDKAHSVHTVRLSHDIPSFAYVVTEADRSGEFDAEKAKASGIPAGPLFGDLSRGETITLPDGRKFDGRKFTGPTRKGRKVIIGGDNDAPDLLSDDLTNADLLIHEATLTEPVKAGLKFDARHSTAKDVARAAEKCGLSNLILTHISARFAPVASESELTIDNIKTEARAYFSGQIYIAEDFAEYYLDRSGILAVQEH